jgi:hypothetical protein
MVMSWVVPDRCTLPAVEQPLRVAEFDALFSSALCGVERPEPTLLRLWLDPATEVEAMARDLAARETGCCSFFTFSFVRPAADRLQMDIGVPAAHCDVLDALASRAAGAAGPPR